MTPSRPAPIIEYTPSVKIKNFYIFFTPEKGIRPHKHGFIEIMYVYSGKCEHSLNGQSANLKKGDFVIMDRSCNHGFKALTDDFMIINCLFFPNFIDPSLTDTANLYTILENHHLNFSKDLFTCNPVGNIFSDSDGFVRKTLTTINSEFIKKEPGYLEMIQSYLIQLLIHTMRTIYTDVKVFSGDDTIQNILKFINMKYTENITLNGICDKYNYSVTHICAKFKRVVGISFTEYLQKVRIENSMRLLVNTNKTVESIANEVGYLDIKSFYKIFRKYTNTTPSKFRKGNNRFTTSYYGFNKRFMQEPQK